MNKLIPAFEKSILDPNILDSIIDTIDWTIDNNVTDGLINAVPIVKVIVGVGKTVLNIQERNAVMQLMTFLESYNAGRLSEDELNNYRTKLDSDKKYAEKELGRVLIVLNSTVDTKKSAIMGRLFNAYVKAKISWIEFCDFSDITSQMFLSDLTILRGINDGIYKDTTQCELFRVLRLESLGLIYTSTRTVWAGNYTDYYMHISDLGKTYFKIISEIPDLY